MASEDDLCGHGGVESQIGKQGLPGIGEGGEYEARCATV